MNKNKGYILVGSRHFTLDFLKKKPKKYDNKKTEKTPYSFAMKLSKDTTIDAFDPEMGMEI